MVTAVTVALTAQLRVTLQVAPNERPDGTVAYRRHTEQPNVSYRILKNFAMQ
jgi:hypothetical protein